VTFFQLATAPLGDNLRAGILDGQEGCWDTANVMTSIRRDAAGRLIIGAMGALDTMGLHRAWAERHFTKFFPHLAGQSFDHFWSGRIMMTHDKLPRIQRLPDGFAVFGYSGRGIAPGTVMGEAAALALLSGDETALPLVPVDSYTEAWTRTKTAFYETASRAAHWIGARR